MILKLVGLLELYSNFADLGKRLRGLVELPERRVSDSRSRVVQVRRRPTGAECAEMARRYQGGETVQQIADALGFHRETVSIALQTVGVARRYHQRVEIDLKQADDLLAAGLTITDTAEAMGIGRTTLVKARRAARG